MKRSRVLNTASVLVLSALVASRGVTLPVAHAATLPSDLEQTSELYCEVDRLDPADLAVLRSASGSVDLAVEAGLRVVGSDASKLPSVINWLVASYPSDRELIVAALSGSFPERATSIAATLIGCECSDDDEYARLLNMVIETVPASFDRILDFALNNCPELALSLIEPSTGTISGPPPPAGQDYV